MQETEKYKLKKPDADDFFNIEDFNENTDKVEQALKENAEGVQELKAPSFDDSGTAEGINSFTDFMAKVKSKMNIFEFFRNFKAGLKFILHTGMIVDNYATKEKGFLPDATLVTSLKEQLDEQNKNINFIPRLNIESSTTITDVANWLFAQFQTGIRPLNIFQASDIVVFDETGNFNIICTKFVDGDQLTGIAVNHWTRNVFSFGINYDRSWFWNRMVTNSDLTRSEKINTVNIDNEYLSVTVNWCVRLNVCYVTLYNLTAKQVFDPIVIYDQFPKAHVGNHLDFFNKGTGNWFGSGWLDDGTSILYCRLRKIDNFGWLSFSYPVRST